MSNAEGVVAQADFSPRSADSADDSAWRDSTASMESVEPGTYTLALSGVDRATYAQSIEVTAGNRVLLTVADSDMTGLFADDADATGAGLMAYGDFDADGSIDEAYRVKNDELVEFPYGYHTTVSTPGYQTYFLWLMAGDYQGFNRSNDPEHDWVK